MLKQAEGKHRVLTRVLKVGVRNVSSVKNMSPTFKKFINLYYFFRNEKKKKKTCLFCISWFCFACGSEYLLFLMIETNHGTFSIFSFHSWLWHSISTCIFFIVTIYHTCDISLFRRELPIFCPFLRNLSTKISEFPSVSYTSPYLEFQVSLPNFENFLLCLIILPIWRRNSPNLSFQIYHMYAIYVYIPSEYIYFYWL